jgi:hypothetical protein
MTSVIMALTSIISIPLANHILEEKGLKVAYYIFSALYIFAAWLRCLINFTDYGFYSTLLAGAIVGFGASFVLDSLNLLAAVWFRPEVNQNLNKQNNE